MKTATRFFPLMITFFVISMAGNVHAQGRGHHHDNDRAGKYQKNHHNDHRKEDRKHDDREHDCRHGDGHQHERHNRHDHHAVAYHRHHHDHRPVAARHHHSRPRYVYYRDYNVYYDLRRDVYISYSGRNWSVSASLPIVLHHVDTRRAVRMDVDYYDDDFPGYLATNRPTYTRVYTAF